jgi:hypothetical protein
MNEKLPENKKQVLPASGKELTPWLGWRLAAPIRMYPRMPLNTLRRSSDWLQGQRSPAISALAFKPLFRLKTFPGLKTPIVSSSWKKLDLFWLRKGGKRATFAGPMAESSGSLPETINRLTQDIAAKHEMPLDRNTTGPLKSVLAPCVRKPAVSSSDIAALPAHEITSFVPSGETGQRPVNADATDFISVVAKASDAAASRLPGPFAGESRSSGIRPVKNSALTGKHSQESVSANGLNDLRLIRSYNPAEKPENIPPENIGNVHLKSAHKQLAPVSRPANTPHAGTKNRAPLLKTPEPLTLSVPKINPGRKSIPAVEPATQSYPSAGAESQPLKPQSDRPSGSLNRDLPAGDKAVSADLPIIASFKAAKPLPYSAEQEIKSPLAAYTLPNPETGLLLSKPDRGARGPVFIKRSAAEKSPGAEISPGQSIVDIATKSAIIETGSERITANNRQPMFPTSPGVQDSPAVQSPIAAPGFSKNISLPLKSRDTPAIKRVRVFRSRAAASTPAASTFSTGLDRGMSSSPPVYNSQELFAGNTVEFSNNIGGNLTSGETGKSQGSREHGSRNVEKTALPGLRLSRMGMPGQVEDAAPFSAERSISLESVNKEVGPVSLKSSEEPALSLLTVAPFSASNKKTSALHPGRPITSSPKDLVNRIYPETPKAASLKPLVLSLAGTSQAKDEANLPVGRASPRDQSGINTPSFHAAETNLSRSTFLSRAPASVDNGLPPEPGFAADESKHPTEAKTDLMALAREVYPFIKRMIIVDRERLPL